MAPASCSLWPCCEQGVTSCLSLCLFLALPEGPCGHGCDGSAADPRGYDPPGPGSGCLPGSAASADGHSDGPWSSCRVPGLFFQLPDPPQPPPPTLQPQGCGHCHSCQQAGCVTSSARDPQPHRLTQLVMDKESHTCPHTFAVTHSHKYIPTQGHTDADIKKQTHYLHVYIHIQRHTDIAIATGPHTL